MASTAKRQWKLQEYVAHGANVNCLALGHKSGRVLVTGGDDKKVNLWAVGKPNCILSLSGHTTPVECVRFGGMSDELVCAGSMSGALKIWDLEQAKILRTLTGHKANIKSLDFHMHRDFIASGSLDTSIKVWDIRRKGCIYSYKGHTNTVNSVRFSPDGKWLASAGEDGIVKLWDLSAGKMLTEFRGHSGSVNDIAFHPSEFLLASCSSDRTIKFWDLENFQLVTSTEGDTSAIRCIHFNPDGECLYSGSQDMMKVYGWEPARTFDSLIMGWGKVANISTSQNQLIGASFFQTNVAIYVVDLKRVQPFGSLPSSNSNPSVVSSPFQYGNHVRKSFNKERPANLVAMTSGIKSEENEASSPEAESADDNTSYFNDIKNPEDYRAIFQPRRRELNRTPTPLDELLPEPEKDAMKSEPFQPEIIKHRIVRTEDNMKPQVIRPEPTRSIPAIIRAQPVRTVMPRGNDTVETSTDYFSSRERGGGDPKEELSRADFPVKERASPPSSRTTERQNMPLRIPLSKLERRDPAPVVPIKPDLGEQEKVETLDYVPTIMDKPAGLDVDEFLPKKFQDVVKLASQPEPEMSEAEAISSIMRGHDSMVAVLTSRHRNLQVIYTMFTSKDLKTAIESAVHMSDLSVMLDLMNVLCLKPNLWNLDVCVIFLPPIQDLLQSRYEAYMTAGCQGLRLILRNFANVIKSNITPIPTLGIDLCREERYNKCLSCYNVLVSIRAFILKRQTLQGKLGQCFRELHTMLQTLDSA